MTPSKAILAGSVMIAAAILASAALFRPPGAPAPAVERAPGTAVAPAPSSAAQDRYEIAKVQDGASWRLDRQTGEMTYCRVENDRMFCAKSREATELPKASAEQLEAEREMAKEREAKESNAVFDKVMALFDRFLKFVERQTGKSSSSPQTGDSLKSL